MIEGWCQMGVRKKYNFPLSDVKIWFLDELKKNALEECTTKQEIKSAMSTIKNFENFMYRVQHFEDSRRDGKKIFDLNKQEFITFLKLLGCASQECLSTYLTMLKQYREFSDINGLSATNIDFIKTITFKDLDAFLDTDKVNNRYFTRAEIMEFIATLGNYQDKALVLLIFEGINGTRNNELIKLKKQNIDFQNSIINLPDRTVPISKDLTDILYHSILEKEYSNVYISSLDTNERKSSYNDTLVPSDYVLRPTMSYINQNTVPSDSDYPNYTKDHVLPKTITARFYRFTKENVDFQYLTMTTLYNSGLIERAIQSLGACCTKKEFVDYCVEAEGICEGTGYKLYGVWQNLIAPKMQDCTPSCEVVPMQTK